MEDIVPFVIGLVVVALLLGLVLGTQFVSERFWFSGIALFAVPQIYLFPVIGVYPSFSLLASLGPLYSCRYFPEFFRLNWFRAFVALCLIQMFSLAWSQSPLAGVRHLIYLLPFALAAFVGLAGARLNGQFARKFIFIALWFSIIEAALVMLFRVAPGIESAFLGSRLAGFAISPNVLGALFDGSPNNVFDPAKAGGLFVNANTASALLGFCSVLAWNLGANVGMRSLRFVAVVNWIAVFFTGSKAGAIMAIVVPGLALALEVARSRRIDMRLAAMLAFVGAALTLVIPFALDRFLESGFVGETSSTLDVRQVIWRFATQEFFRVPLKGMGFGGWEARFPFYALANRVSPNYPAHNAFMIAWTQSGLIATLCLAAFVALFLQWTYKAARQSEMHVRTLGNGLFFGALWFWLQAQGENFGILGEQHFTPLLGLLSGVLLAQLQALAQSQSQARTVENKL